ncbi:NAD(P)-dependent oxidoreductase [Alkalihalobacillus oceani]|uniref:NAD(P)-dependent oxidoreductase n=1 Tax=Halalkalibacter oceani TaxID=1653776 RepID=UPI00203C28E5|nr:NAD(P)-dependent oxidoreductase [Halalkalibacter oceani]MCM3760390.1 NAD(P)-dependent oxidoreductase [Halalkalibacter oceani]
MKKIAFIGLGIMGKPMAGNLIQAGYDVTVFDLVESPVREMVRQGAKEAQTIEQLVERNEIVITMLPNSPHVKAALTDGAEAVIHYAAPGTIVIDMSSISPKVTKEIHEAFQEKGVGFIDAPVSGGRTGAEAGTLSIMVGGDRPHFDAVKDVLDVLGGRVTYMGGSGAGQTTKICNQIMVAGTVTTMSEALAVAKKEELDLYHVRDVLQSGGANCWHLEHKAAGMIAGDYSPSFKAELLLKDVRLAVDKAQEEGLDLPLLRKTEEMFARLVDQYGGGIDYTAIFKQICADIEEVE